MPPTGPSSSAPIALDPSWQEFTLDTDRYGALVVDAGSELLVWSGWEDELESGLPHFDGVAVNEDTGAVRPLPPSFLCWPTPATAVWAGEALVAWSRPSGRTDCVFAASYSPTTDAWTGFDESLFRDVGADVVLVGDELVEWRQGIAVDLADRTVREVAPYPGVTSGVVGVQEPVAYWSGNEILVLDGDSMWALDPTADSWIELSTPSVPSRGRVSVQLGDSILVANYEMRAGIFSFEDRTWSDLENLPLRISECVPTIAAHGDLAVVRGCWSMALLHDESWLPLPLPGLIPTGYGGVLAITDEWLYVIGRSVVRRSIPVTQGEGATELSLPIMTFILDVPPGWQLIDVAGTVLDRGSQNPREFMEITLRDDVSNSQCTIRGYVGSPQPRLQSNASIERRVDGETMAVQVETGEQTTVTMTHPNQSDWAVIVCPSGSVGLHLASYLWSPTWDWN